MSYILILNKRIKKLKDKSNEVLYEILPRSIANELIENGRVEPKRHRSATILFTDFEGFTQLSDRLSAEKLVTILEKCYSKFDDIVTKMSLIKIKTIGDSYMCAGGLVNDRESSPEDVVNAAIEILRSTKEISQKIEKECGLKINIRIGINTGAVVAGVIGRIKSNYDIWGDAVNVASRIENICLTNRIYISESTYQLVKDKFNIEFVGDFAIKGKGIIKVYQINITTIYG